ncbi:TomO hydrophobic C-terminal domain-containing protein [Wolbachia endosymbiont (group B) of Athalia cordata]|uniref:TomO hydrophobic C-terminal domain-containing protein n=1 Tax=Wolbachia endosymbiont (group B) of Athalia cordata TaxID=2953986 RepID=UPI0022327E43|nr:vWA domain-containing protein [Wolbachia endosymbiont (group B) of Athalia cordata]
MFSIKKASFVVGKDPFSEGQLAQLSFTTIDNEDKDDLKHLIFVLDISGSMSERDVFVYETQKYISRIEAMQKGVCKIISELRDDTKISVIQFDNKATILLDGESKSSHDKIKNLQVRGGTNIGKGVLEVLKLESYTKFNPEETAIFVITDGKNSEYVVDDLNPKEVIKKIKNNSNDKKLPRIYSVGVGKDYDFTYITELQVDGSPLTHVQLQSDFGKVQNAGLLKGKRINANITIKNKDKKICTIPECIVTSQEKDFLFAIDPNLLNEDKITIQVCFDRHKPIEQEINVTGNVGEYNEKICSNMINNKFLEIQESYLKQRNSIEKTKFYLSKLFYKVPHYKEYNELRLKIYRFMKEISENNRRYALSSFSSVSMNMTNTLYITPVVRQEISDTNLDTDLVDDELDMDPITLETIKEYCIRVFSINENTGEVYTHLHNLDGFLMMAKDEIKKLPQHERDSKKKKLEEIKEKLEEAKKKKEMDIVSLNKDIKSMLMVLLLGKNPRNRQPIVAFRGCNSRETENLQLTNEQDDQQNLTVPTVPSYVSENVSTSRSDEEESVVNSKQLSYQNKNNPNPQDAKSKLPTIAAPMLAIAGVALGVAIAVHLEMLVVGIVVGACCLVAAAIIYYCNKPSKSLENSNAEAVVNQITVQNYNLRG